MIVDKDLESHSPDFNLKLFQKEKLQKERFARGGGLRKVVKLRHGGIMEMKVLTGSAYLDCAAFRNLRSGLN